MSNAVYTTLITTPQFDRGRQAALDCGRKECQPNWDLIARENLDFQAGFRYAWRTDVEPWLVRGQAHLIARHL